MQTKITQDAGRKELGSFAPEFAHFNDDVLFGENWNIPDLDLKTRCLITVTALISSGITDTSLTYHLKNARANGVSRREIAAAITHIAFYAGWPKAWAAFRQARDVWADDGAAAVAGSEWTPELKAHQAAMIFPVGKPNDAFAQYFSGRSYLAPLSQNQVGIYNVTFEPSCRNNWHVHKAAKGGGQILIGVAGRGIYKEEGKTAVIISPGSVVNIPANIRHWHGAAENGWFSHLAVEVPGEGQSNEWLEPVGDEEYLHELDAAE